MDVVAKLAREHKPKMIIAGVTAYPRQVDFAAFAEIAEDVGAYLMADIAHISGLCATGYHPSPIPYADATMATTHKLLRGPRGALIMTKQEHAKKIDRAVFPGLQGGPHDNITAGIAVCLKEALTDEYKQYCGQVIDNARAMADEFMRRGFTIVSGGTDVHLLLVDLSPQDVSGKVAQAVLDEAGITTNANMVPNDQRSAFDPSGLRIGTPAATTRGFKEAEIRQVTNWICDIVENIEDEATIVQIKHAVREMCHRFPLWY